MKYNYIYLLLLVLICFSSCKENEPEREEIIQPEPVSNIEEDQKILEERLAPSERTWDSLYTILRRKDLGEEYKDTIQELFQKNKEKQEEIYKNFIREYPNSLVSGENLNGFKFTWGKKTTANLFKLLTPAVQDSEEGKMIKNYLTYYNDPKVNDSFINFKLPNADGQDILLSDNLDNYTLLEFWASWCIPCRKAHPDMIEVYEQYKSHGLTIVGVSVDQDQEDWKTAVSKDNLPWINLWDPEGRNSKVQYEYGIKKLSTNFLIGPNGKIVAKDVDPAELKNFLKENLRQTAHNNI